MLASALWTAGNASINTLWESASQLKILKMTPYHKFLEDKVMLSGASWEKTAAERRYNPLSYPLKMPRQKKLKLNSRFSFIQASLLWWEAFHGGPRDEVDRNAHIQSPQRPRKHFSSFPSYLFPEFLFNSTNKGLHSEMIYWGHTPEWLKYWARLNRTRRKGFKLQVLPLPPDFPVLAGPQQIPQFC